MTNVINLNKKRKAKNRLDKQKKATENRIKEPSINKLYIFVSIVIISA